MASRAAEVFAQTRTGHTFWLSKLSMVLAERQGKKPLSPRMLAKLTAPDLRVEVLELLPIASGKRALAAGPDKNARASPRKTRGGRNSDEKLVLARCRLLIGVSAAAAGAAPGGEAGMDGDEKEDGDVHGVVAFSLHLHPAVGAGTASSAVDGAPPLLPQQDGRQSDQRHAGHRAGGSGASLFLPSGVHDLRFLRAGVEVWVWGPYEEVVLNLGGEEVDREGTVGVEGGRDGMREGSGEEERVAVALVCSRFGVLV